jgi:hypothetical protein
MLSVKWGFAVVVAALIAISVAGPAHALAVKVFDSNGNQCGTTDTDGTFLVTCDSVTVSGTVAAVDNGTTRQFSVTNFVATTTATVSKTIRVNATHNFSGADSTAGIGWTGDFKRGTLVTNIAKSSSTSFTGSVTCLPSNSVTPLATASYTVPATATSYTANHFGKGTTKTPVPTNCTSQTLTGDITVQLQATSTLKDSLSAHSSAELLLGEQAPVKLALVSHFVKASPHPTIDVNPTTNGKVLIVLYCKKTSEDAGGVWAPGPDPDQEKWSLPNPFGTLIKAETFLGDAPIGNNKVGKADMDGNGCVDAKIQFEVLQTGIQCGDTSAPFQTRVDLCIEETVCTGPPGHPTCNPKTTCESTPVLVDVTIDTSQWCPAQ